MSDIFKNERTDDLFCIYAVQSMFIGAFACAARFATFTGGSCQQVGNPARSCLGVPRC